MVVSRYSRWFKSLTLLGGLSFVQRQVWASTGTNLPFNTTLSELQSAISGPLLLSVAIILIVVTCVMLAFGEWGDGFKKIINMVLWLSVAFSATSFITTLFGGGAVC